MPKAYADAYTFDGKLVGMCQGAAFSTMFYNMDILNEAGWDTVPTCWDELIQCCKDIKEKTGVAPLVTAAGKHTTCWMIYELILANVAGEELGNYEDDFKNGTFDFTKYPEATAACRRSPRTSSRAPLPLWKKMLLPTCLTVWPRCASPATGTAA